MNPLVFALDVGGDFYRSTTLNCCFRRLRPRSYSCWLSPLGASHCRFLLCGRGDYFTAKIGMNLKTLFAYRSPSTMPIRVTPDIIVVLEGTLLVNTHGGTFHLQREGRADRSVQNEPTDLLQ